MQSPILLTLTTIILVAGLVFPPMAPYTAVYVVIVGLLILAAPLALRHRDRLGGRPFQLLLVAFLIFGLAQAMSFHGSEDLLIFLALLPVWLSPVAGLMLLEEPRFAAPQAIGMLCLAGSVAALMVALNDVFVLGIVRAGGGNNPIHFSGLSIMLGFMALVGLFGASSRWRFVYLAGPLLAGAAVALSGSRGPALAAIAMVIAATPFLVFWFRKERTFWIIVAAGAIVLAFGFGGTSLWQVERVGQALVDIPGLFDRSLAVDPASTERLVFLDAALLAFKQAPWFGHGSGHIGAATTPFIPEAYSHMWQPAHLHSDIADFAVANGILGVIAYFLLIAAPLFAFTLTKDREIRRAVLLGGIVLSVGYFILGLTNAMFGILPQTTLFGLMLGILFGMAKVSAEREKVI